MIQQNINQALGIGALLTTLSPAYQKRKEQAAEQAAQAKAKESIEQRLNPYSRLLALFAEATPEDTYKYSKDTKQEAYELFRKDPSKYERLFEQASSYEAHNLKRYVEYQLKEVAKQEAEAARQAAEQEKRERSTAMGYQARVSSILDKFGSPLEVKDER